MPGQGRRPGRFGSAARELREIGAELARRFREAQVGTVRPGLTLEDGTLVVTDNYLKVRIPAGSAAQRAGAVRSRTQDDGAMRRRLRTSGS